MKARDKGFEHGNDLYGQLFEQSLDGVLLIQEGSIIRANAAFCTSHGYEESDLIGRDPIELLHPDDREIARERVAAFLRSDKPSASHTYCSLHRNGTTLTVEVTTRLIRWQDRAILQTIVRNVTSVHATQIALDRETAYFEQLFTSAPEAVVLCDGGGIIQRVNREFCKLFQYTHDEAIGRNIDELVAHPGGNIQDEANSITQTATEGSHTRIETVRHRKDGSLIYVSVLAQPIFIDKRQVGVYAIYRDITRRVGAEQQLHEEKARFEELFEAAPEAIVLCTNESIILRANQEFGRLFGYAPDDVVGKNVDELLSLDDRGVCEEAKATTRRIAAGKRVAFESERRAKDGRRIHVSILGKPIRLDGEQVAVYGMYRDIGARVEAQQALHLAQSKVEGLHTAAGRLERAECADDIYHITTEAAERILGFPHGALDIAKQGQLITQAVTTRTPKQRIRRAPIAAAGSAGRAYREQRTLLENDVRPEQLSERPASPIRALLTAPIRDIGVFQVAAEHADAFTNEDARFLEILLGHTAEALSRLQLQQELLDKATRDELTGVFNRRYFNEVLQHEVRRATRYKYPIGLLMIDVNRFKEINDTRGHQTGDEVLKSIAEMLVACLRETDFIVRYGGDEFLVALLETGEETSQAAERIRNVVRTSDTLLELVGRPVTVSVGTVAWQPESGTTVEAALASADARMYEEKRRR